MARPQLQEWLRTLVVVFVPLVIGYVLPWAPYTPIGYKPTAEIETRLDKMETLITEVIEENDALRDEVDWDEEGAGMEEMSYTGEGSRTDSYDGVGDLEDSAELAFFEDRLAQLRRENDEWLDKWNPQKGERLRTTSTFLRSVGTAATTT